MSDIAWDLPNPFVLSFSARPEDIDGYGHVNNTVYLKWIDAVGWAHSDAAGMSAEQCRELGRGFAMRRHEIDYLASAYADDEVQVGTWITELDGKLRSTRQFQIVRLSDSKTLLRAKTTFICTNLETGRPVRMPEIFKEVYQVDPAVAAALQGNL